MLVDHVFAGTRVADRVSTKMAAVLAAVEVSLVAQQMAAGEFGMTLAEWIGLDQPITGARPPGNGYHSSGSAIDVNYDTAPYIATRSGATFGGEAVAAGADLEMRRRAVEVYDRAVQFGDWGVQRSDTSVRVNDSDRDDL